MSLCDIKLIKLVGWQEVYEKIQVSTIWRKFLNESVAVMVFRCFYLIVLNVLASWHVKCVKIC